MAQVAGLSEYEWNIHCTNTDQCWGYWGCLIIIARILGPVNWTKWNSAVINSVRALQFGRIILVPAWLAAPVHPFFGWLPPAAAEPVVPFQSFSLGKDDFADLKFPGGSLPALVKFQFPQATSRYSPVSFPLLYPAILACVEYLSPLSLQAALFQYHFVYIFVAELVLEYRGLFFIKYVR